MDGDPVLADMVLTHDSVKSAFDAMDRMTWIVKDNKSRAVDMFEKTK